MSQNFSGIDALDWHKLVDEALHRRKAEKMTQKEHAALASVSIPTIVAFDRGERTLTLAKAFDILRVVGLVKEQGEDGAQEAFVQDAFKRWHELTSKLPENSPGRMPHGFYRIDYALEGDLKDVELPELQKILQKAVVPAGFWGHMFENATQKVDGVIEHWWLQDTHNKQYSPIWCDFWQASPSGRLMTIRGYREDSEEILQPGKIIDPGLSVWGLGEGLLHAARLAKLMKRKDGEITVHFHVLYTGLSGRLLSSMNPLKRNLSIENFSARSDEAMLETTVPVARVESDLAGCVYPLVASLFERFGVSKLSPDYVKGEIDSFLQRPFGALGEK